MRRFRMLEELQQEIVGDKQKTSRPEVEVLFEDQVKNRWKGRTTTNKIVFVESEVDPSTGSGQSLRGKLLPVTITWTGPWSMQRYLRRSISVSSLRLIPS